MNPLNQNKYNLHYDKANQIYAYGTKVDPENSIMEIRKLVTKHKCKGWMDAVEPNTNDRFVAFQIPTENGDLTVRFYLKRVYLRNKYRENESYRLLLMEIKMRLALSKLSGFMDAFLSNVIVAGNLLLGDMVTKELPKLLNTPKGDER